MIMQKGRRSILGVSVIFALATATLTQAFCLLCGEEGVDGLERPDFKVDQWGKTCSQLMLELALQYDEGDVGCDDSVDSFGAMCCDEEEPDPIQQTPTSAPVYTGPMGDYPPCPICYNGNYPGNPAMVINILGIGADSCRMYYHYGERGLIRTELCDTLQSFAFDPCGCDKTAPPSSQSGPLPPAAAPAAGTPSRTLPPAASPTASSPTGGGSDTGGSDAGDALLALLQFILSLLQG
ncbi:expressed unknown protein [Seminavis robusta]|uniref:Uncharacterized protein n=1 Tax=Seminavis robusta TaxID=568900 RepID=A0A9N8HDQ3_9STRA|nr:expressed unknown protein [Seminavis robusta]|eukprot:Sro472_g150010.1 n/a (237) ;mRNA; f:56469-57271